MKVALPIWDQRISPVFDVATALLLVDIDGRNVHSQRIEGLSGIDPASRAQALAERGVEVLICGAISLALEQLLTSRGIRVISRKCGEAVAVLEGYMAGRIHESQYAMPGCQSPADGGGPAARSAPDAISDEAPMTCCDQVTVEAEGAGTVDGAETERRWIARVQGRAIGSLALEHDEMTGRITRFDIDSEWQNSPAPCRLLQQALRFSRERGLLKIKLDGGPHSQRAMQLFGCLGFQRSRRPGHGERNSPEFYLNLYRRIDEKDCLTYFDSAADDHGKA